MSNEPVAWIDKNTGKPRMEGFIKTDYDIPLYTHPVKEQEMFAEIERLKYDIEDAECVKLCLDRENVPTEDEGGKLSLWGRVCKFANPAELTDEEISEVFKDCTKDGILDANEFARAILRKAQEK